MKPFQLLSCLSVLGLIACNEVPSSSQNDSNAGQPTATPIPSQKIQQLALGAEHSCALTEQGGVWCWGSNQYGQLGNGSYTNTQTAVSVSGLNSGVSYIASGDYHSCAIKGQSVYCWGYNQSGQLGKDPYTGTTYNTPTLVSGLVGIPTLLAAGTYHSCAVTDQSVQCWGDNNWGELGNGTTTASATPTSVINLSGSVESISAAGLVTCVLETSQAYCWGSNASGMIQYTVGQNGQFSGGMFLQPTLISGLQTTSQLAVGWGHICASIDGSLNVGVMCWGSDDHAQLGNQQVHTQLLTTVPSVMISHNPVIVDQLAPSVSMASTTSTRSCALIHDQVKCWGSDQTGIGASTTSYTIQTPDGQPLKAKSIAGGQNHTCAITDSGVYCWGSSSAGQLGEQIRTSGGWIVPGVGQTTIR